MEGHREVEPAERAPHRSVRVGEGAVAKKTEKVEVRAEPAFASGGYGMFLRIYPHK